MESMFLTVSCFAIPWFIENVAWPSKAWWL